MNLKNAPLERFLGGLAAHPYCMNSLGHAIRIRERAFAAKYRYIEPDVPWRRRYLKFDIDWFGAAFAHEEARLPPPTLTIVNPKNNHAHLLYELSSPVFGDLHPRAKTFYNAVGRTMRTVLKGDAHYSGLLTKNPLHEDWWVFNYDVTYELGRLAAELPIPLLWKVERDANLPTSIDAPGRNCDLFDRTRFFAYRIRSRYWTYEDFSSCVELFAEQNNQYSPPLPCREVQSISNSVSRWTWENLHVARGKLGFSPFSEVPMEQRPFELKARQREGAHHSHQVQRERTLGRIREAIELIATSQPVTVRSISHMAGISVGTAHAYLRDYAAELFPSAASVQSGVYQETAEEAA